MIIWPFISEYIIFLDDEDFSVQLTQGLKINYTKNPKNSRNVSIEIVVNEKKYSNELSKTIFDDVLVVKRNKHIIEFEIEGVWKQCFYLKTKKIWLPKRK